MRPRQGRALSHRGRAGRAGLAAALWLVSLAAPASAHILIRLDILAPQPGEHVGRDTEAVIAAQPMLAGINETTFVASLDGHTIDAETGRPRPDPAPTVIRVGSPVHVPLHRLSAGAHRLTIHYRNHGMIPVTVGVSFRVATSSTLGPLVLALAALAVTLIGLGLLRRRRGARRSRWSHQPAPDEVATVPGRGVGGPARDLQGRPSRG